MTSQAAKVELGGTGAARQPVRLSLANEPLRELRNKNEYFAGPQVTSWKPQNNWILEFRISIKRSYPSGIPRARRSCAAGY